MPKNGSSRIPTNLRAILLLEVIGRQGGPLSAAEIGRLAGLPKQTAHRLCNTLVEEGYLARDTKRGPLRPGRRAREMASGILHISSGHVARHQILKSVADQVGETVNFVMPEDLGMSYKDRVETNWPFRIQLPVGSHVPFHCTAYSPSRKPLLCSNQLAEYSALRPPAETLPNAEPSFESVNSATSSADVGMHRLSPPDLQTNPFTLTCIGAAKPSGAVSGAVQVTFPSCSSMVKSP